MIHGPPASSRAMAYRTRSLGLSYPSAAANGSSRNACVNSKETMPVRLCERIMICNSILDGACSVCWARCTCPHTLDANISARAGGQGGKAVALCLATISTDNSLVVKSQSQIGDGHLFNAVPQVMRASCGQPSPVLTIGTRIERLREWDLLPALTLLWIQGRYPVEL